MASTSNSIPQNSFAAASLYVGDLHPDVSEAVIYEIFSTMGPVASIRICRDALSRKSLGYAYVNYHSPSDAERALGALNYTDIKGSVVRIMWSHRDPSLRKSGAGNIFVKNLDRNIDNKALSETFSLFGKILSCKVSTDENGKSRGYGFVHFDTEQAAKHAIERVNGMQIGDKTVYVAPFVRSQERSETDTKFTNIFMRNIPTSWDEGKLRSVFAKFGKITSMALRPENAQGQIGFINYEESTSAQQAVDEMNDALVDDQGIANEKEKLSDEKKDEACPRLFVCRHKMKEMLKRNVKPRSAVESIYHPPGMNLFIKNLDESIDDEKLRELFEQFGNVISAKVMRDFHTNVSRGFGFVSFMNPDEATKAVSEMHLRIVCRKPLYVGLHEEREKRMARLRQQQHRTPPHVPHGMHPSMQHSLQYEAPHQMFFAGPGSMQTSRSILPGFQPGSMMPGWRAHNSRPFVQPTSFSPHINPLSLYTQSPMHPMVAGAAHNMHMSGLVGRGGSRPPRSGGSSLQQMAGSKQSAPVRQSGTGFKYTAQARNRIDHQSLMLPNMGVHSVQHMSGPEHATAFSNPSAPLTAAALAAAAPTLQKQMLGEKLFPLIARYQPELAGKITGMMLEMDNSELLILLDSEVQLKAKVEEALRVLHAHHE